MERKTLTQIVSWLEQEVCLAGHPPQAAWWLLEAACNTPKALLLTRLRTPTAGEITTLERWLGELQKGKPLQYILESMPFLELNLTLEAPILIPRPETEAWVADLVQMLERAQVGPIRILDIGTGTGCIALSLAKALPDAHVTAVDINPQAVALAQRNAQRNNVTNCSILTSDLFSAVHKKTFHLIVSNPPYISREETDLVDTSVRQWEDDQALFADENGTSTLKKIIELSPTFLEQHPALAQHCIGNLFLEIGFQQGAFVTQYMKRSHFNTVIVYPDDAGKDRVVAGSIAHDKGKSR